ncbi:MAG: hypothetical protein BGO15_09150 [Microbacterium sp. 71-23]|uniref:hypothetical protein n=1 Tax=Microbacterium sp. 71-23 TaxID=1895787 RepID=UPI000926F2A3|nr:hypothetical protein [Microbacterium sp. 71-23]MBN9611837.1 hypothetical protein [Actinomycetota bacterium]OJU75150.1 MAG: hypothetical protein BGO15_09150 [Microbacterium sp. 71-23]
MRLPRYTAESFTDSGWDSGTPERKARFVNSLLRFIADDFPRERFTRSLYMGLSTHGYFGFIAHYDIHGFYDEQMSTPARRAAFLDELEWSCDREAHLNRPDLWSDVKTVLAEHLDHGRLRNTSTRRLSPPSAFGATRPQQGDAPTLF